MNRISSATKFAAFTATAVGFLLLGQAYGDDSKTDLFLAPSQDWNTLRKAWSTKVSIDYRTSSFEEILKDLAKKTTLDIRFGELKNGRLSIQNDWFARAESYQEGRLLDCRGIHFLGIEEGKKAQSADFWLSNDPKKKIVEFRCETKVPLAAALQCLANQLELEVSYRKNCIVLATERSLAPEIYVTRSFQIKKADGMPYSYVKNGDVQKFKLNVLDQVAVYLARSGKDWTAPEITKINQNPTDANEKLRKIYPGLEIRFDKAKKVLTINAHPEMLFKFQKYYLGNLR